MSRMAATAIYNSRWLANGRAERFKLVRITLKNNRSFCHLSLVICPWLTNPCEALKKPLTLGYGLMTKEATSQQGKRISLLEVPVVGANLTPRAEDAMKTCPECGIALRDEYQFCPEDGAAL